MKRQTGGSARTAPWGIVRGRIVRAAAFLIAATGAGAASGQTAQDFNDFQAKVTEGAARIAQYQQVLQNPDVRVQYEAVRLLLKSKDPALVRIAKEHALFSTNPVLRNAAILSIFEAGGNLRIEVAANDEAGVKALDWLRAVGGSHDGRKGSAVLTLGAKDGECWKVVGSKDCSLRVSGTHVQFNFNSAYQRQQGQSAMELGPDGVLRGRLFTREGQADASIDLKE